MNRYRFRKLFRSDLGLIERWLAAPHVRRWWGDPEREFALIRDGLGEPSWRPYLVGLAGRPLAYLQCYDLQTDPNKDFAGQPPGTRGIDYFIGDSRMTGRGHGAALLAAFLRGAFRVPSVSRVIADPDPSNEASLGALRRAGFADHGEVATPSGPARLMVCDRPAGPGG
ncbi:MAG: GNAT family N-acetyltransferase [Alphaproteobacteria bacterium]|nr:GNAT family N-acetyltransferase [Alphaproteobacteria bacterium]